MALIVESSRPVFDTTKIEKGDLLYAKHRSWDTGRGGIVTGVSADRLIVQFHPGIGNVMNHFIIPASEASDGQWEVRWSADLTEIASYPEVEEVEQVGGGDGG